MLPPIKGFIKSSLAEWEGKLASVVMLPGCDMRCPFCSSPHLLGPTACIESIPFEPIKEFWTGQRGWIEGVVVSGGEPLIHDNIEDLLIEIKALGLPVMLETNGSRDDRLRKLLAKKLVDYIAMDVKAPLNSKYDSLAGVEVDARVIRRSIRALVESGRPHEFRTTFVPSLLDAADVIDIARALVGGRKYVLQEFHHKNCLDPKLRGTRCASRTVLRELAEVASSYLRTVVKGEGYEYLEKTAKY